MSSSLGVAIFLLSQLDGRRSLSALRELRSLEWLRLLGAGLGFFANFGVRRPRPPRRRPAACGPWPHHAQSARTARAQSVRRQRAQTAQ
jgi:hypothetical protein